MTPRTLLKRFNEDFDPKWLRLLHAQLKPSDPKRRQLARIATQLEKYIRGWTSQWALTRKRKNRTPHECLATCLHYALSTVRRMFPNSIQWEPRVAVTRKRSITAAAKLCKAERVWDERWLSSSVIDLVNARTGNSKSVPLSIIADALMDAGCDDERLFEQLLSGRLPDRLIQATRLETVS